MVRSTMQSALQEALTYHGQELASRQMPEKEMFETALRDEKRRCLLRLLGEAAPLLMIPFLPIWLAWVLGVLGSITLAIRFAAFLKWRKLLHAVTTETAEFAWLKTESDWKLAAPIAQLDQIRATLEAVQIPGELKVHWPYGFALPALRHNGRLLVLKGIPGYVEFGTGRMKSTPQPYQYLHDGGPWTTSFRVAAKKTFEV